MRALFLLLLLIPLAAPAAAQSADALYHDAAALYVRGDDARAEAAATRGLQIEPDHARLRALLDAIRQRDPGAGAGGAPDADEPQPGAGPPQPGDNGTAPEPGDAPGHEPDAGPDDAPGQPDPHDGPPGDAETAQPGATGLPADGEPGGLSREDAERLLRAVDADEQELLRRIQRRPERPSAAPYPDW